jgi:hypothetical protein
MGELKEAKLVNAGIGMDGPSRLALGRSVLVLCAVLLEVAGRN